MKIICWIVGLWRTIKINAGPYLVSGHEFVETSPGRLECERCGEVSE